MLTSKTLQEVSSKLPDMFYNAIIPFHTAQLAKIKKLYQI